MEGIGYFFLFFVLIIVAILLYVYYRFLRTLRDLLRAVSERNRGMAPGLVWLNWIPVFNLAWMFVTIVKIRDAARAEFAYRGVRANGGEGFRVGMTFAVASVLSEISAPPGTLQNESALWAIAVLSGLAGFVSFVCWILYWMKAANLRDWLVNTMGASRPSPAQTSYQPAPWQLQPESSSTSPPTATQDEPWLGTQTSADGQASTGLGSSQQAQMGQPATNQQQGPWLGAQQPAGSQHPAGSVVTCPSCGAAGQTAGESCRLCMQPIGPIRSAAPGMQLGGAAPVTGVGNCPHCGAPYRADGSYCSQCGRPTPI